MTNEQLYVAIGVPMAFNAALFTLLALWVNAKIGGLENSASTRFEAINNRFDAINQRFDDMKELWRAELHRVEGVLDARLRHFESEKN